MDTYSFILSTNGFGKLYNPKAHQLNCRILKNYLPFRTERTVQHAHQGKIVKKIDDIYIIQKNEIEELRGLALRRKVPIETPRSQRKRLLNEHSIPSCIEDLTLFNLTGPYAEYPAWESQHQKILCRICYSEEEEYNIFCRLRKLWFQWTQQAERDYRALRFDKFPQYKGYPPWKGLVTEQNNQQFEQLNKIRILITTDFWKNYHDLLLFNFCNFFSNMKPQYLENMYEAILKFVENTHSILEYKWPISAARIVLDCNSNAWIPDDSSRKHFEGVAMTMAGLLSTVIETNLRNYYTFIQKNTPFDTITTLIIPVRTKKSSTCTLLDTAKLFLKMANMPRIETKMFPKLPTQSRIDVTQWIQGIKFFEYEETPHETERTLRNIKEFEEKFQTLDHNSLPITSYFEMMTTFITLKDDVKSIKDRVKDGRIVLDQRELKDTLMNDVNTVLFTCRDQILAKQSTENDKIRQLFSECSEKIVEHDVLTQLRFVLEVQKELPNINRMIEEAHLVYTHVWSFVSLTNEQVQNYYEISRLGYNLHIMLQYTWSRIESQKEWITSKISDVTSAHNKELSELLAELLVILKSYRTARRISDVLKTSNRLRILKQKIDDLRKAELVLSNQRQILQLVPLVYDVDLLHRRLFFWYELAALHYKVLLHDDTIMRVHVVDLEDIDVSERTEKLFQSQDTVISKAHNCLQNDDEVTLYNDILNKMKTVLDKFINVLPILKALRNKGMKERHWKEILQEGGSQMALPSNPMVVDLLDLHLIEKVAIIKEVNALALKEQEIEQEIERMMLRWQSVCFAKKNNLLLTTEQSHLLNFQISKTHHLIGLPAAKALMAELEEWLSTLKCLRNLISLFYKCSTRWRTIEGVFSTDEMAFQLPDEYKIYKETAVSWEKLLADLTTDKPFMKMLHILNSSIKQLQEIANEFHLLEAGFQTFIIRKRIIFPRFYLLSDTQLLELLSIAQSPAAVRPFLSELFTNITNFEISRRGQIASTTIGKDILLLDKPVNLNWSKRHVEKWLSELDAEVKRTIRIRLKEIIEKYNYQIIKPHEVTEYIPQIIILYFRVTMTYKVESSMRKSQLLALKEEIDDALKVYRIAAQENYSNDLYRNIGYILISTLYTIETFLTNNVIFSDNPIWSSQIRYYWNLDNLFVRFHEVSTRFDYELSSYWSVRHLECEQEIKNLIIWDHYGLPIEIYNNKLESSSILMTSISNVMGRPLVQLQPNKSENSLNQLQGCLVLGAVAFIVTNNTTSDISEWSNIASDIEIAAQTGNFKYFLESEHMVNSSTLLVHLFGNKTIESHYNTSQSQRFLKQSKYSREFFQKLFRFYNFEDFERLSDRVWVFLTEAFFIFHNTDVIWTVTDNTAEKLLLKAIYLRDSKGFLESEAVDTAIKLYCFSNFPNSIYALGSGLLPVSRRICTEVNTEVTSYSLRKIDEIINLIEIEKIVTVYGKCLSGKSYIIQKAVEAYGKKNPSSTIHHFSGSWEDFYKRANFNENQISWLIFDSSYDDNILNWICGLMNNTLSPGTNLIYQKYKNNIRIIVESDSVPEKLRRFPSILVEVQKCHVHYESSEQFVSTLENHFENSKISLFYRQVIYQRIAIFRKVLPNSSFDKLILSISLNSLMEWKLLKNIYVYMNVSIDAMRSLEPANIADINIQDEEISPWMKFLLFVSQKVYENKFIPLLIIQKSAEYFQFLEIISRLCREKSECILNININNKTKREDILSYIEAAQIHMFDHEKDIQPELILVLTHLEQASNDVLELVRCFPVNQKIIILSKHITKYERLYRRIVPIVLNDNIEVSWNDESCEEKILAYTKNMLNIQDLHDIIEKEFKRNRKNVFKLDYDERVSKKIGSENEQEDEILSVRSGTLMANDHLIAYYNNTLEVLYEEIGEIPDNRIPLSPPIARLLCIIEKGLAASQHVMIVLDEKEHLNLEYLITSWLPMICYLNHQRFIAYSEDYKSSENVYLDNWQDFVQQQLRELALLDESSEDSHNKSVFCVDLKPMNIEKIEDVMADVYTWSIQKGCPVHYMMDIALSDFHSSPKSELHYPWNLLERNLRHRLQLCLIVTKTQYLELRDKYSEIIENIFVTSLDTLSIEAEIIVAKNLMKSTGFLADDEVALLEEKIIEMKSKFSDLNIIALTKTLICLSQKKKEMIDKSMARYLNGLEKMRMAESQTASLRAELLHLQPELVRTSNQTGTLMSQIERETIEVENTREVVAANESKANQAATKAQALKAESEADLADAIPALEAAIESLETLNQNDISALKTMRFPPYGVRLCMEAVCILLGEAPVKVKDPLGGTRYDYWIKGQKLLSDLHFLRRIRNFPRDKIPNKTMKILRNNYLTKEEFDPEVVKQCSLAAEGLSLWINAIEMYHRISKIVEPKKEKLRKAEVLVKQHMKELESKRKALQKVTEKLQSLSDQFSQLSQKKQELQLKISNCEVRIERAERLVSALDGERNIWLNKIETIESERYRLPQTCLMQAIAIEVFSFLTFEEKVEKTNELEKQLFPTKSDITPIDNYTLLSSYLEPMLLYNDSNSGIELLKNLHYTYITCTNYNDFNKYFQKAAMIGVPLFLEVDDLSQIPSISFFIKDNDKLAILNNDVVVTVGTGYRLIISYPYNIEKDSITRKRIATINMKLSYNDIRQKVSFAIGRRNWSAYQTEYLSIEEQIKKNEKYLDEMEINMMDALGKKDDIDDENAMELLSKTYEIQNHLNQLKLELQTNKEQLDAIRHRFSKITDWATNLVLLSERLGFLNIFYTIPIYNLIEMTDVELFDYNELNIDFDDIINKLSNMFNNMLKKLLHRDHQIILDYIIEKRLFLGIYVPLSATDFHPSNKFNDLSNLTSFIARADSRKPLLIVVQPGAIDLTKHIPEISKGFEVRYLSVLKRTSEIIRKSALKSEWIVLFTSWTELEKAEIAQIEMELINSTSVDPEFRLLYVVQDIKKATKIACRYGQRMCLSDLPNLESIIQIVLEQNSYKQAFERYTNGNQKRFLQLIIFHYSVYQRWQTIFQIQDLYLILKLFHEYLSSNETDEEFRSDRLLEGIIKPLYSSKLSKQHDQMVLETIFLWIFEKIGKSDDATLARIIGNQWTPESIILKLQQTNDKLLTGYCSQYLEVKAGKEKTDIWLSAKFLLNIEKDFKISIERLPTPLKYLELFKEDINDFALDCTEFNVRNALILELHQAVQFQEHDKINYLASILKSSVIDSVNVQYIRQPNLLLGKVRAQFAVSQKLPLSEVELHTWMPLMDAHNRTSNKHLELTNCRLCGGRIENGELKEHWKDEWETDVSICIRAVKMDMLVPEQHPKSLPVLTKDGNTLGLVKIRTNYPQLHWKLRGTYIKTWMN